MNSSKMNPSGMERFQASQDRIDAHHELLANPAFQIAEDMALLHYGRVLASQTANAAGAGPQANPQQEAMMNGLKLTGAQEFLHYFRCLAEKPLITEPPGRARTLNHNQ